MRVIAVTQRVDKIYAINEIRDALDQRLVRLIFATGCMPVPVPNQSDYQVLRTWLAAVKPQGVVLSGGNDIGQNIERDLTEGRLLDHARLYQLPVLGICRGMQMMAYWSGVSLHPVQGHKRTRHRLSGEINGEVNSYHSFSLETCPEDFEVMAKSEDGEVEAIRHRSLPWEGWMWHPEREVEFSARDVQRIKVLFGE